MIYVVLKPRTEGEGKLACIVKAKDVMQAKKITGLTAETEQEPDFTGEWAGFTDKEIETMLAAKEGYIAKDL